MDKKFLVSNFSNQKVKASIQTQFQILNTKDIMIEPPCWTQTLSVPQLNFEISREVDRHIKEGFTGVIFIEWKNPPFGRKQFYINGRRFHDPDNWLSCLSDDNQTAALWTIDLWRKDG